MAPKYDPNVNLYRKPKRALATDMMESLAVGGVMRPVLDRVLADDRLRMDIRHNQFDVYYGGGKLMAAAWGKGGWDLRFDANYFKGLSASDGTLAGLTAFARLPDQGALPALPDFPPMPALPRTITGPDDGRAWADAFDGLMAAMDARWKHHPKTERADCQDIARVNHTRPDSTTNQPPPRTAEPRLQPGPSPLPPTDFVVLDLEYQWAQRRFDLMAARRHPTPDDPVGWAHPRLAYVEVKSEIGACTGKAGLADHARDFADIVTARDGAYIQGIKDEFATVIRQKQALGLIAPGFPFQGFSPDQPELVFVTVDLDMTTPTRLALWNPVHQTASDLGLHAFQLIQLQRRDLTMTRAKVKWI